MKVVINPKYNFLTDFIYHLPGCFFKDGETIYQGRNILKKYDIQAVSYTHLTLPTKA